MELIRYNAVNNISEDSFSILSDYLEQAIRYAYINVHALAIFVYGHSKLEEVSPCTSDNLSSWNYFPNRYIDNATKLLARAISDYRININVLLKDSKRHKDNLWFTALWIASDCQKNLSKEIDERAFLSLFYDEAYIFAEFLATWYSILSGKPVRYCEGIPRTPQIELMNWLLNK